MPIPYSSAATRRSSASPSTALLTSKGQQLEPAQVYRKIQPTKHGALTPEEAWVRPDEEE